MQGRTNLARMLRRWAWTQAGGIAPVAGVIIMAVAMLTVGGIEMAELVSERSTMQDVADEAALNAAAQMDLSLAPEVLERAKAFGLDRMTQMGQRTSVDVQAVYVNNGAAVQVTVHGHRPSFFGNLLPPGGWDVSAHATATREGRIPLCILATNEVLPATINLLSASQISAPGCLVQSNNQIVVGASGHLIGNEVRAVSSAVGPITPAAKTDAAVIADPFTTVNLSFPGGCSLNAPDEVYDTGGTMPAGLHCGKVKVNGGTVTMVPGEHYFAQELNVGGDAVLNGSDVVLGFAPTARFDFNSHATVNLSGRKTGSLAGFVVYASRSNILQFLIESDHVNQLLGTIYIPNATLNVDGSTKVAQSSAWTVIVAKAVSLSGNPTLVMNTDYASTDVPVPAGVGLSRHNSKLLD